MTLTASVNENGETFVRREIQLLNAMLVSSGWNTLVDSPASGNTVTFTEAADQASRFYRVELLP